MVETRLRDWTPSTKPRCFSCCKPTKTATKTKYGIMAFCQNCANKKRENRESRKHVFYARTFKMENF